LWSQIVHFEKWSPEDLGKAAHLAHLKWYLLGKWHFTCQLLCFNFECQVLIYFHSDANSMYGVFLWVNIHSVCFCFICWVYNHWQALSFISMLCKCACSLWQSVLPTHKKWREQYHCWQQNEWGSSGYYSLTIYFSDL
jgi:hypothetical protein